MILKIHKNERAHCIDEEAGGGPDARADESWLAFIRLLERNVGSFLENAYSAEGESGDDVTSLYLMTSHVCLYLLSKVLLYSHQIL